LKLKSSPHLGFAEPTIRGQVDLFLSSTSRPRSWRPVYGADQTGAWTERDDIFAPLID
jgi:hypothetical protein